VGPSGYEKDFDDVFRHNTETWLTVGRTDRPTDSHISIFASAATRDKNDTRQSMKWTDEEADMK